MAEKLVNLDSNFQKCWNSLVKFLHATFKLNIDDLREYERFAQWMIKHHGLANTVKVLKDLNSLVRRIALNQDVTKSRGSLGGIWFDCFETGIPRALPFINEMVKKNKLIAILICNCFLAIRLEPAVDLTTVESSSRSKLTEEDINKISSFVTSQIGHEIEVPLPGPTVGEDVLKSDIMSFSLKAGPNHKVALLGAPLDCAAITRTPGALEMFCSLCDKVGNMTLKSKFLSLSKEIMDQGSLVSNKDLHLAKLVFLSNPGGKTRIVYILNWFHQNLMFPLHKIMMKWLRSQPQDGTFTQRTAALKVQDWTRSGRKLWSFDLTAATDRWPRIHQKAIIQAMFGQQWSEVWLEVMEIKPWVESLGRYTSYSVGQPMGAYGSWAALAVSHHWTIRFLAHTIGLKNPDYVVLGDDVVIADEQLASLYRNYMVETLGVDISIAKSFAFENQISGSSAEFAKNIFYNGEELTPVSPVLLREILVDHQWYKAIDVIKWFRNLFGISPAVAEEDKVLIPKIIDDFLSLFPEGEKEKITIVITSPDMVQELEPIRRSEVESISRLNPWKGTDGDKLKMLYIKGQIINDKLSQMFSSLQKLKTGLREVEFGKLPDPSLRLLNHPVQDLLKDLDDAVLSVARCIARGDHPPDAVNLLTDIRLLYSILVEGKPLSTWDRSMKDALKKDKEMLYVMIHKAVFAPDSSTSESAWYDDWS